MWLFYRKKDIIGKNSRKSISQNEITDSNMCFYHFSSKLASLLEANLEINNESDDDDEEFKMIQAQKITRLEASLRVCEDEIRRLTQKVIELEEQILTLEHKNGRLIMDR